MDSHIERRALETINETGTSLVGTLHSRDAGDMRYDPDVRQGLRDVVREVRHVRKLLRERGWLA